MSQCARPDCHEEANSSCSVCAREQYCSSNCQKLDWKIHRSMCPILKKLPNKLQSYREADQVINEVLESKKGKDIRVLEHLLSYAENQFGKQVTGVGYRERGDGQIINNWDVEIRIFYEINSTILHIHSQDASINSRLIRGDKMFPYLEKSLFLLSPWLVHLEPSNETNQLDYDQSDYLLHESYCTEQGLSMVMMKRNQFNAAEGHCKRCLDYSRRYRVEGEKKTTAIFSALLLYIDLRQREGNFSGALTFSEEAYNLVVTAYDPVHHEVTQAANALISCLIQTGNFFDAERFAQITYSNLRDPKNGMDQESEEMARGSHNLADTIFRQDGDLKKAEELAREALRIRTKFCGPDNFNIGFTSMFLATILQSQSKLGDETKNLFERSLRIFIRNEGPDGPTTASGNSAVGQYYRKLAAMQPTVHTKQKHLVLAKSYIEEALRIETKIHSPIYPNAIIASSRLSKVLSDLSKL